MARQAVVIREQALGPGHSDMAMTLNNLAVLYKATGEYAKAEPLYQRALAIFEAALGPGESDTICLALEIGAQWVILDERPARRLAQALGLPLIGTLGVLLASKRRGLLPAVQPCVDALVTFGFRLSPDLYDVILADAKKNPAANAA